jgi:hypothetical protein
MTKRICFLLILWLGTGAATPAAEFEKDFRDTPLDLQLFQLVGSTPQQLLKPDVQGLRITLPANQDKMDPVGIAPRFPIQGDFEITTSFEIPKVTRPKSGYGIGVSLWISKASSAKDAASVGRFFKLDGDFFVAVRSFTTTEGKRAFRGGKPVPTETTAGKLRLKRIGPILFFLAAPSDSAPFMELYKWDWGTEDLNIVRVAAEGGGNSPEELAVVIKDLRIQAGSLSTEAEAHQTRQLPRLAVWVGIIIALAVVGSLLTRRMYLRAGRMGVHQGTNSGQPTARMRAGQR